MYSVLTVLENRPVPDVTLIILTDDLNRRLPSHE